MPPSLEELIAPNHLVRVVDKFVSQLCSDIWNHLFTAGGAPAYPPRMMLKIILYAYSCQIYTSRQIARAVRQDVTFMWLAGMEQPSFNTINRFRSEHFKAILDKVFLTICAKKIMSHSLIFLSMEPNSKQMQVNSLMSGKRILNAIKMLC